MENSNAGEIALNTSNISVESVKSFLDNNDLEGAKNFLNQFLNSDPNNLQAAFIMAQILETEGNYPEAAALYERVFPVQIPDEFLPRVMQVYELGDRYDKVYDIIKQQYEANKDDVDLIERLANTCCILNKTDEAIELYINLLKKQPNNIVALRQLTDMYENTNPMMFRATKAKLFELEENYEAAEKEYKKAFSLAEKDEDILQIRYKLAKLYKKQGKNEQALDEYIFVASATDDNFTVFTDLAEIYMEMNTLSSAINVLKKALNLYPDNQEVLQLLADIYTEKEDYAKAETFYEKLLDVDANNIENMVNLAKVYLQLDKTDKTKEILLKAENIAPTNTEVLTALAGFYTFTQEFEKAKNYCNQIIQKLPQSPLGYRKLAQLNEAMGNNHLAHFNYGIYHEHRNEIDEAVNEYTNALQYNKDDFETIKRLANLHETLGELEIAADYYHSLFEASVDIVTTTQKVANVYMKLNDYEMAQRYLEKSLKYNFDVELLFTNAKCLYKLKDFEGALEALEEYKEKTKSLENIEETNALIEELEDKKEHNNASLFSKLFGFLDK